MTYAVLAPKKINNQVKVTASFITDDIEAAKKVARETVQSFNQKGYKSWAKQVRLVNPLTPDGYLDIAEMAAEYGHELDWNSGGNSFKAQSFIEWANILRVRAEQLADPESFADE